MRHKLLIAVGAVAALCVSCNKESANTYSEQIATYNYVARIDGSSAPVIKKGFYDFSFDLMSSKVTISTSELEIADNDETSFVTDPFTYKNSMVNGFEGGSTYVLNGTSQFPCTAKNGMELSDLHFQLSPVFYVPPTITYTPDPTSSLPQPDLSYQGRAGNAPRMRYRLGSDYIVYTFWPDLYYKGVTQTDVMGDPSSYMSTMEIGYRVKFDIKNKKAHVVMYNVQFNPNMPKMECLILPDLDVDFNNNGYAIEAENIAPLYIEGGKLMENPSFPFTTFKFTAETNMVEANCEFTVAGRFEGFFKGNYMETIVE
ncbi:MAG: hypothetical protein K2M69_04645 [Muribaculaceae bacterium]|nr:hypothetical protein [Muribaculaceae bacterium]